MKKITAIIVALLLVFSLFGCKKAKDLEEPVIDVEHESSEKSETVKEPGESATDDSDVKAESIDKSTSDSGASKPEIELKGEGHGSWKEDADGAIIATGDHASSDEYRIMGAVTSDNGFIPDSSKGEDATVSQQIQSGTLTAGEWKDTENFNFWSEVIKRDEIKKITEIRNIYTDHVVAVKVKDSDGNPCFNAKVDLTDEKGSVIYSAVSDVSGNAYLYYNLNKEDKDAPRYVTHGTNKVEIVKNGVTDLTIDKKNTPVKELDLMLMIDTTGSMGDELEYLKKELDNVIDEVCKDDTAISINVSVNFYRDDGDDYEIKEFEFTGDIAKAVSQLNEQSSNGGGDYPEAVHKALSSIVNNHQWRDGSVKLCFLVLDAPPHSENEIQSINADMQKYVESMAKRGIRIIPVASSGVDKETEILCRSWAMMTGGTYTFLTDHSGVGGSHIEPTIGQYNVEKLNALMIRIIKQYCGI